VKIKELGLVSDWFINNILLIILSIINCYINL